MGIRREGSAVGGSIAGADGMVEGRGLGAEYSTGADPIGWKGIDSGTSGSSVCYILIGVE